MHLTEIINHAQAEDHLQSKATKGFGQGKNWTEEKGLRQLESQLTQAWVKIVEDKTFGLKNKNKSAKVQKWETEKTLCVII